MKETIFESYLKQIINENENEIPERSESNESKFPVFCVGGLFNPGDKVKYKSGSNTGVGIFIKFNSYGQALIKLEKSRPLQRRDGEILGNSSTESVSLHFNSNYKKYFTSSPDGENGDYIKHI